MKHWILSIGCCFFFCTFLSAQVTVKGKVIDFESGEPLIGATVLEVGTANGTTTDIDGKFEIEISNLEIEISYGYLPEVIDLSNRDLKQELILRVGKTTYTFPYEVVVSSNSILNEKTVGSISVLDAEELNLDNQTIIAPALNRVPGVFMHSGALNTNRITIRGIGNRSPFSTAKIKAYLDEIPLTTGVGETTIEDIDLSIVDGVNVLKGPTASIYGAGLGGMIGLYTDNTVNDKNFASIKTTVGSYGLIRNTANLKVGKSEKYKLHFNFNDTHSDGYRDNNEYDRTGYTLIGTITPNYRNKLTFIGNYTKLKAFIPSSLNQNDFENEPSKAAFTWGRVMGFEDYEKTLVGLSYRSYLAGNWLRNTTSLFTTTYNSYESRPFNILQEERLSLGGRTAFEIEPAGGTFVPEVKLGLEYFNENYDWQTYVTDDGVIGPLLSNNQELRTYYNLFLQAQWNISNHTLITASANFNDTKYELDDLFNPDSTNLSGTYTFDKLISPYFSISHDLSRSLQLSNIELSVYAVASHGFSPPSLEETLTPDGQINPDIQPEKGWNFELGSRGDWKGLTWNISAFTMNIEDLLVARRTDFDQFVGINAGKTKHNGFEAELGYLKSMDKLDLNVFLNYTYSDFTFEDFVDGEDDYSGNKLTGTAPHLLTAGLGAKLDFGLYGNLNFQYVDAMPMRDDNSIFSESYQVLNFKLGWQKTFSEKWSLDVFAGINNIADEHYASMILINAGSFGGNAPRYYYPGLPRNYYGGLQLKYHF